MASDGYDRARPDQTWYRQRDRAMAAIVPVLLAVVHALPRWSFGALASLFALGYRWLAWREMRIVRGNLERVLGIARGSSEMRRATREFTKLQIAIYLEGIRGIRDPESIQIEGREAFDRTIAEAMAPGRGFLAITGHLGSWELAAAGAAQGAQAAGGRMSILAKKSRIAPVTKLLGELRARAGCRVLWSDSKRLLRDMLGALRKGEGLGFAMDQKPRDYQGPVVDFFGYPTEFVSGPATVAGRTQCAVVGTFCIRLAPFRYRLIARPLLEADHGRHDEVELTQLMANAIEREIRDCPNQWCWNYRRWLFEGRRLRSQRSP